MAETLESKIFTASPDPNKEASDNHKILILTAKYYKIVQALFNDHLQIEGLENFYDENMELLPGPFLLTLRHRSYFDIPDYAYAWSKVPQSPKGKAVARHDYHDPVVASKFIKPLKLILWSNTLTDLYKKWWEEITIPIYRTKLCDGDTEEEKAAMREINRRQIEVTLKNLEADVSIAILPEQTTKSNGSMHEFNINGTHRLSKIEREGVTYNQRMMCVNINYDNMAVSHRWRHRTAITIGNFFTIDDVTDMPGETEKDRLKNYVRKNFIDHHVFTVSELGTFYLMDLTYKMKDSFTYQELSDAIDKQLEALQKSDDHLFFDSGLLDPIERKQLVKRFFRTLKKKEYISTWFGKVHINRDNILTLPTDDDHYKKQNIFLYTLHTLLQVAYEKESVGKALSQALDSRLVREYWVPAVDNPKILYSKR